MGAEFGFVLAGFVELFHSIVGEIAVISVHALLIVLDEFADFVRVKVTLAYSILLVMIIRAFFMIMQLFDSTGVHFKKR